MRLEDYENCRRVLARDPRNGAAYAMLGELLERDGKPAEALAAYEQALALDAKQVEMRHRVERLQDALALAESGQLRCPYCRTIQVKGPGRCWSCGSVLDIRRATVMTLGYRGVILLILAVICLVLSFYYAGLSMYPLAFSALGGLFACIFGLILNHHYFRKRK